jgi:hypothetical protein
MSGLVVQRRERKRPDDYDQRVSVTMSALRLVRMNERAALQILEREEAPVDPGFTPIYPSFAVLQLYLLGDPNFVTKYVNAPILSRGGVVNTQNTVGARAMVQAFASAAKRVRDIEESDSWAALRTEPFMYEEFSGVYLVLRGAVLMRLDALRGTLMSTKLVNYIFVERWRADPALMAQLTAYETSLTKWRRDLAAGQRLTREQSSITIREISTGIVDNLLPRFIADAKAAASLPLTTVVAPPRRRDGPVRPRLPSVKPEPGTTQGVKGEPRPLRDGDDIEPDAVEEQQEDEPELDDLAELEAPQASFGSGVRDFLNRAVNTLTGGDNTEPPVKGEPDAGGGTAPDADDFEDF